MKLNIKKMTKHLKKQLLVGFLVTAVVISFSFKSSFFEIAKQIEIYTTLFKELNINYVNEISPSELTNKAIKNTLKNLDPYTNFYTEQDVENARIRREGEYGGIGVIAYYTKEGIILSKINKDDPADKAGLKVGDIITKIDGFSLKNLKRDEQSSQLKGMPSTKKSLEIDRRGTILKINLQLGKIIINPVPFYGMIDEETGYIVLTRFNTKASKEVKKAFKTLKKKGMVKLVFDLRYNPGGSLYESINIVNFFIPKGSKIVSTKGKIKKNSRTYKGTREPLDIKIPMIVLVNGRSASASEIVSGALQDYDRAVIMGERSFGKGLVQRYFKLTYGTQLKVTISKYYTPSGRCIQELDYANRNSKTGKVPKFSDRTVNSFKTKNGRIVYDGGGVMPDVKINFSKKTEVTKKLIRSRSLFNFSTNFVANHPSINKEKFSFTDAHFNQFTTYLLRKDTLFVTKPEKLFKKAYASTEKKEMLSKEYQKILELLKNGKIKEIIKNKDIISKLLEDKIVEQVFYEQGKYQHQIKKDKTIKEAVFLLKNQKKYYEILSLK